MEMLLMWREVDEERRKGCWQVPDVVVNRRKKRTTPQQQSVSLFALSRVTLELLTPQMIKEGQHTKMLTLIPLLLGADLFLLTPFSKLLARVACNSEATL